MQMEKNYFKMVFNQDGEEIMVYDLSKITSTDIIDNSTDLIEIKNELVKIYSEKAIKEKLSSKEIGYALCEILNTSEQAILELNKFLARIKANVNIQKSDSQQFIIICKEFINLSNHLINISSYWQILNLDISSIIDTLSNYLHLISSKEDITNMEKLSEVNSDILEMYNELCSFYGISVEEIEFKILSIMDSILTYINLIEDGSQEMLYLQVPPAEIECIATGQYHYKFNTKYSINSYKYNINNFQDFLNASWYQILINDWHIRACDNCGLYFTFKKSDTEFCNRPLAENSDKTCKDTKARLRIQEKYKGIIDYEYIINAEKKQNKIRQYFADQLDKTSKYSNKEILENKLLFQQKCKEKKKELKRYVNEEKYIILYQNYTDYLEIVDKQIHQGNFDISNID